jgi:PKD repeat protein
VLFRSYDPDGNIVGYRWDFENDKIFDTDWMEDNLITHGYATPGNYTIILQVKDNEGSIATASHTINIMQLMPDLELPIPQINGPYNGYTNENITFNSTGTYDPDGTIINYTWYFGDGNISYMQNPAYAYAKSGNYTIILKVTDNDNLSNLTTAKATILDRAIKEPEEKELPLTFPLILIITIIIAIIIALLFLPKGYQITVLIEKDDSNKNEDEAIESKVDELLSESDENKENK